MRQKLGMVGVVALVAAVWASGFLWARGDLFASSAQPGASASPTPETGAEPGAQPDARPSGTPTPGEVAPSGPKPSPAPTRQGDPTIDPELLAKLRGGVQVEEPPVVDTVVATFNLLGSSHTARGGNRSGYALGPARMNGAIQVLDRSRVSIVGFQEFQGNQARAFAARAQGWSMYPGVGGINAAGQNAVAWRTAEWELVQPGSVAIPYFNGSLKQMPVVLLRHRESGMLTYVSTFHNPASTRRVGNQTRWRDVATQRQVALVKRLRQTGIPHLVTGDFNERTAHFCRLTGATGFTSPAGGSSSGGCRPPARPRIDWIYGDPEIEWTGYADLRDALVRRTTDHPVIVAGARLDAADFPEAWAGEVVSP